MDKRYKRAMDKIHAGDRFKKRVVAAMKQQPQKRKSPRYISAIAAALVVAVILTVLLIPRSKEENTAVANSFTLTAAAAENAPLSADSYVKVGGVKWGGGAYQGGSFGEEFLIDLSVTGENIKHITYSVSSGKIGLKKSCKRITDSVAKDTTVYYSDGTSGYASVDYDYYDSVTCDYKNQFDAEDEMLLAFAEESEDFDRTVVQQYFTVFDQLGRADTEPLTLTGDQVKKAFDDYINEVLRHLMLSVTVAYTDGSTETKTVGFSADCVVDQVRRKFYAYDLDENDRPYPVHSLKRAYMTFPMDGRMDASYAEEYNKVKDIFTEKDLIEFDDFDTEIIVNAKLESASVAKGGSSKGVPENRD